MKTLSIVFAFLFLATMANAQQLNFTWGTKLSGAVWDGNGQAYLDTTASTSTDFYVDLNAYYWIADIFPQQDTSGVNLNSSDRMFIGTLYTYFDCQGTGSPTTDSVKYNISVYPGVYSTGSRSLAAAKWGDAITLENVLQAGDYLSITGVYVKDALKLFPPEVLKFSIGPATTKVPAIDDSVACYWRFVHPEVYNSEAVHIQETD